MLIHELIAELEARNPNSKVYLLDEYGDRVRLDRVYDINSDEKPEEERDILLMELF